MEEMFVAMCEADGYEAWYDAEEAWEGYAERMVAAGFDPQEVEEFFSQMAEDL
jgi:hypothetical protein